MLTDIEPLHFINNIFTWGESISVVGSSSILNHRHDASHIDANDEVMRFNHALVDGFEEKCGAKTTIRLINEHSLRHADNDLMQELEQEFPATKKNYIYDFENLNVIIKFHGATPNIEQCHTAIDRLCQKNNVAFISPKMFEYCAWFLGKNPSCGFFGIMAALYYCDNVQCFGFNFNNDIEIDKHYFEKGNKIGGCHDFNKEYLVIKDLVKQNKLTLFPDL